MKKALVLVLTLVLVLMSMTGAIAEEKEQIKLAGMVFLEDQFMQMLVAGYEAAAAEDGAIELLTANSGQDQAREAELIDTYIQQGVQGIAIAPCNTVASIAPLRRANESGAAIALTNMFLTGTTEDVGFISAGFSSVQKNLGEVTGSAAAEFVKNELGGQANIALVQYRTLDAEGSDARSSGFVETVQAVNPDAVVVADQDAWEQSTAIQVVSDMLTAHPEINVIWAANEGGTIGAAMAVANAGLAGKVWVFGTDGSDQTIALLRDEKNVLQAVTAQDPYMMGYNSIKTLAQIVRNEEVEMPGDNVVPGTLLTRTDPDGIAAYEEILARAK